MKHKAQCSALINIAAEMVRYESNVHYSEYPWGNSSKALRATVADELEKTEEQRKLWALHLRDIAHAIAKCEE